jgi:S1-C subfamily serine protease
LTLLVVGLEIKIIGNDAGEKLSILSGFISRIDRNAPKYSGWYRDHNTCYYQANAAATGGSSGSPVVNVDGYAVALQAGGRVDNATTDYFLPLDAPLRALQQIRKGVPVARGGIQCSFLLKPFEVCRRLGLTSRWEAEIRAADPKEKNMLVAEVVLPEGPSDKKIKEGDLILKVNGMLVTKFQPLENVLDGGIDHEVRFLLQRGGLEIEVDILVEDLSKISPNRFVTVASAGVHDLSYQMAHRAGVACKGVYMCESGTLQKFENRSGYLIDSVNRRDTSSLDEFVEVVKEIPDNNKVIVRYRELFHRHTIHTKVMSLNRHWPAKMKMITRNDATGQWDFEVLAEALPRIPPVPFKASIARNTLHWQPAVADIVRSFVAVRCTMPLYLEGISARFTIGMGLVIDAERGIVLVSRDLVPHSFCDIEITIADSIPVDGKAIFLHPTQNYSLVQYQSSLVEGQVRSATFDTEEVLQGASTNFVGYTDANTKRMVYTPTTVTRIMPVDVSPLNPPKYRPINMDWIGVDTPLSSECECGVLMASDGKVQAVWMSCADEDSTFRFGLGSRALHEVLSRIQDGGAPPNLRILPAEFDTLTMLEARVMGLSEELIEKVHKKGSQHQLFIVKRVFGGHQSGQLLEGDVLLTLNGELVTKFTDLDVMYWHETLDSVILRDGNELSLKVNTVPDDMGPAHIVSVAGLYITKPHLAVRQQRKKLPSEVYIAARQWGSPACLYEVEPTRFITHINDISTPSLESVLEETLKVEDNTCKL